MNKKLTLLFFTSLCALPSINANNPINQKYNPNTAVIAWDFHDVLVQKNWWSLIQRIGDVISSSNNRWGLIKIVPSILYDAYKIKGTCSSAEELIDTFIKKYSQLRPHREELLQVINQHDPINESVNILNQLKVDGYRNFLASNIGAYSLQIMKKRYPYIFNQLDGFYIPHTQRENGNHHLIGKPCVEYFQELRLYLKSKGVSDKTAIIFIDDNLANIESANKSGLNIHGIHFTSPEQLNNELEQLINTRATNLQANN